MVEKRFMPIFMETESIVPIQYLGDDTKKAAHPPARAGKRMNRAVWNQSRDPGLGEPMEV
jgi:hypothetical protein